MSRWPIVARAEEFRRASSTLKPDSDFRGAALVGEAGIGKTTLAHALAANAQSSSRQARMVQGAATTSDVPLGALQHIVAIDDTRDQAAMLTAAHRILAREQSPIFVVDDAHLLDPLSLILIHQLVVGGAAHVIVTIPAGVAVPDTVTALWKEHHLLRLDLRELTRADTAELARAVLDDAVDDGVVEQLHRLGAGNPLLLRRLITGAMENGTLVRKRGRWRLAGALQIPSDLDELLESRLESLSADELKAVEIVAVAEVLEWHILRILCDADAIARAEHRGMITLAADGSNTMARLTHPAIGEVVKKRIHITRSRELNGLLVQQMSASLRAEASKPPDVVTRIRLARFMTRSDTPPDLDLIVHASGSATARGDFDLAEELAQFAVEHGGGLSATIVLADALTWQRRAGDAEALLSTVDTDGADESEVVRWGCLRAANLFFGLGQPDAARAVLAALRVRVDVGSDLDLVTATEVTIAFFAADLRTAMPARLAMCESETEPSAEVWATMATVGALGLAGRADEVPAVIEQCDRVMSPYETVPQRFSIGFLEILALTLAGDLPAAESACRRYSELAQDVPYARAVVDALIGRVEILRGRLPSACEALGNSVSAIRDSFSPEWVTLVGAWLAQAEAMSGHADAAVAALAGAEDASGPQAAVFLPELELARAWERACVGETQAARAHSERAAQLARQAGMYAVEAHALHTAVRFGARSHATRLTELARTVTGPFAALAAAHAGGLAARDGNHLDHVATEFEKIGAMGLAADAAAHASGEHSLAGTRGREWESSSRALWFATEYGLQTPALAAISKRLPITDREREFATLVAAGLSNREVAQRLNVSLRTVEGHLSRIYTKLGVQGRDHLARLLPPPTGESQ